MPEAMSELETLLAERAIDRALKSYCRGVDRRDAELVRSVYHDDAIEDHGGAYVGGPDGYVEWLIRRVRYFVGTTHNLHNVLIDIHGDEANVESYCTAHHVAAADNGELTVDTFVCRYIDRFENRPGIGWRIAHRIVVREWRMRQPLLPEAKQPPGFALPRHDRTDLCYLERLNGGPRSGVRRAYRGAAE
jgi:ketosteroid isomerase-like protein